jgi:hypothetical protein
MEQRKKADSCTVFNGKPEQTFGRYQLTSGARVSVVVKALCYKPEGRGLDTPWGDFFLIYLTLPAALGPGVHSASNRNEYKKHKNVSGE